MMSDSSLVSGTAVVPTTPAADVNALIARLHARTARGRGHRPRLRRPAARARVCRGRLQVTPVDVDPAKVESVREGRSYIPDVASDRLQRVVKSGHLSRDHRLRRAGRGGRHQHLRADAAPEDQGPRPLVRRRRRRVGRQAPAARSAGRPRVDDLSGDDRGGRPADAGAGRARRRPRLLPRVLARARRPGQRRVAHRQHPEGRRRHRPRVDRSRVRALRRHCHDDRAGLVDGRRGDGEAAREHLPRRQHRDGQRARADVPPDGHRRLGSDRRRQDEAVRLHAVLSRARDWAGTASRSTRSI